MEEISVGPLSTKVKKIDVDSAGIVLRWTVYARGSGLVPTTIRFTPSEGGEVVEILNCPVRRERNAYVSPSAGTLEITLDNSGAFLSSLSVGMAAAACGRVEEELAWFGRVFAEACERYGGVGPLEEPYEEASAPPGSFIPLPEPKRPSLLRLRVAPDFPGHEELQIPLPLPTSAAMAPPEPRLLMYVRPRMDRLAVSRGLSYAVDLFFANKFFDAMRVFGRDRNRLPLAALGTATIGFLRALLTFRPEDMERAQQLVAECHSVAARHAPPDTFSGSISRMVVSERLTAEELEGVLVSAEASLVSACLHLLSETAVGVVQGGLAIRSAHMLYSRADAAVGGVFGRCDREEGKSPRAIPVAFGGHTRDDGDDSKDVDAMSETSVGERHAADIPPSDAAKMAPAPPSHYDPLWDDESKIPSRVLRIIGRPHSADDPEFVDVPFGMTRSTFNSFLFGMGGFNVVASALPPIVTTVIAILGYPCDRARGIAMERACLESGGARSPLAAACLLMLYSLFPSFLPRRHRPFDPEARVVLTHALARYPTSVMFLWLAGRFERGRGRLLAAERLYARAMGPDLDGENKPDSVRALCVYEIGFAELSRLAWRQAQRRFETLAAGTSWSTSFFTYAAGALALTRREGLEEASDLIGKAPKLSERRVNGRPISAEQFVIKRASEFASALSIPAVDLVQRLDRPRQIPASLIETLATNLGPDAPAPHGIALQGSVFTVSAARIIAIARESDKAEEEKSDKVEEEKSPGDMSSGGGEKVSSGGGDMSSGGGDMSSGGGDTSSGGGASSEKSESSKKSTKKSESSKKSTKSSESSKLGPDEEDVGEDGVPFTPGVDLSRLVWALREPLAAPLAVPALELVFLFNGLQCMSGPDLSRVLLVLDRCLLLLAGVGVPGGHAFPDCVASRSRKPDTETLAQAYLSEKSISVRALLVAALAGDPQRVPCGLVALDLDPDSATPPPKAFGRGTVSRLSRDALRSLPPSRFEDVAVLAALRGATSSALGNRDTASAALDIAAAFGPVLERDTYATPYALYEDAATLREGQDAEDTLSRASNFGKDYSFKIRLAFKMHLLRDAVRWRAEAV